MGIYVHSRCYDNPQLGVDAYFSSSISSFDSAGCLNFLSRDSNGVWSFNRQCESSPLISYPASFPSFPACDPLESAQDGFYLAFLVSAVWLSAWAINVLRHSL